MSLVNHKHSIALEHLRSAIRLYQDGGAYYSVIHLAAASEEILGQIIKYVRDGTLSQKDSMSEPLQQYVDISLELTAIFDGVVIDEAKKTELRRKLISPKNYVKHFNKPDESISEFDQKLEARLFLERAILNLEDITGDLEDDIDSFLNSIRTEETNEAFDLLDRLAK